MPNEDTGYDGVSYGDYDDPNPEPGEGCPCAGLCPIILEKVERIETELLEFKGGNSWQHQWNYKLDPQFSQDEFHAKQGPGTGFPGLFHIIRELYEFNIDIHKDLAAKESYVAMPEHWQLPPEAWRPQLVVLSAEVDANGHFGSAKWKTTIPYYNQPVGTDIPPFDFMAKGSTQGTLILKDNSKIIVYTQNQNEATRVLNQIKTTIDPAMLEKSYTKLGRIKNPDFKEVVVSPKYARFFPQGVKENFAWQVAYPPP